MFIQVVGRASVVCPFLWYKSRAGLLTGYRAADRKPCNMNAKVVIVALCAFQVRTATRCSSGSFALILNYHILTCFCCLCLVV